MFIKKLVIFGFGQHDNVTIELQKGINVFYGLNEAGKTTIQQFILHILFGFPQKNQQLLRYEPKVGGKYGGQVHIEDAQYGNYVIERVKGKAVGDVTVYLPDGTKGHEELLAKILRGYHRQSFEAVFAFNVHQLQQMEHMSEEELSRVLLASGTTGVDQLSTLESNLDKKLGELFKKSGKLPVINQQLEALKNNDQTLKEERRQMDAYEPAIHRQQEITEALSDIKDQEQKNQQALQRLNEFRQLSPLLEERQLLEKELQTISQDSFPTDGVNRFEKLQDKKIAIETTLKQLQQEYDALLEKLHEDFDEQRFARLKNLDDRDSEWREWLIKVQQLKEDLGAIQQDITAQFRLLGLTEEERQQAVLQVEVSLQQEDQFQRLIQQVEEHEEKYRFQSRTVEQLREDNRMLSQKLDELYAQQPSEQDVERAAIWQNKLQRAAEAKATLQQPDTSSNQAQTARYVSIGIAAIAIIVGVVQHNLLIAIIGIIAAAVIFVLIGRSSSNANALTPEKKAAYERLIQEVAARTPEMERLQQMIRQFDDRLAILEEQMDDQENKQEQTEKEQAKLAIFVEESKQQLSLFLARFQLDGELQPKLLNELFRNVREIQQKHTQLAMKEQQLEQLEQKMIERITIASEACNTACTTETLSTTVHQCYLQLCDRQQFLASAIAQKEAFEKKIEEKTALQQSYQVEIHKLFTEAQVDNIDDFYHADKEFERAMQLKRTIQQIQSQLNMFDEQIIHLGLTAEEINLLLHELQNVSFTLQEDKDKLLQEQAQIQAQTEKLLTDQTYGIHLQKMEQQKAKLAQNARQWAVFKATATAIEETMHNLKEKKLPSVLHMAEQYFKQLTGERYEQLSINEDGLFEVTSTEGIRYTIAELSQATKEQAYIALRFALADSMQDSAPFPIIMDDPFVHFDRVRITYMVQLITSIAVKHQILYFTCHDDMLEQWQDSRVIHVSNLKNERGLTSI